MGATKLSTLLAASAENDGKFLSSLPGKSDEELIALAYELVSPDVDRLYGVLEEIFERWAPEASWHEHAEATRDSGVSDLAFELFAAREARIKRAAARITQRCTIDDEAVPS